jgi:formylglycine-generating enzyme required for sulfatase activity
MKTFFPKKMAGGGLLLLLLVFFGASALAQPMVWVEGGTFLLGANDSEEDERPMRRLTLKGFYLDVTEVTQAAYQRCVQAGQCKSPRRYPSSTQPQLPAIGLSCNEAQRYCQWAGKRLPSEAEWEYAARGPDGRRFPWGNRLDCTKANFGNFSGAGPCAAHNPGRILPPKSRPQGVSPSGVHDMAGNVWEWVGPAAPGYAQKIRDSRLRLVRGGSCCSYFAMPTTTNRLPFPVDYEDQDIGFRCAKSAPTPPKAHASP